MSTYTRHRRRRHTWQHTAAYSTAAVLFSGDALAVGSWSMRTYNGALVLATIACGIAAGVLALAAGACAVSIGWHRGRHQTLTQAASNYDAGPAQSHPAGPSLAESILLDRLAAEGRTGPPPLKAPATAAASGHLP